MVQAKDAIHIQTAKNFSPYAYNLLDRNRCNTIPDTSSKRCTGSWRSLSSIDVQSDTFYTSSPYPVINAIGILHQFYGNKACET